MLTKDLIRCRKYKGNVKPQFIDVDNPELLGLADRLISAYNQNANTTKKTPANENATEETQTKENPTRSEIAEYTVPVINTASDILLVKGLNKLLLDRSEFSHEEGVDYKTLRREIFLASGELLKQKEEFSYAKYQESMFFRDDVDQGFLSTGTYPDLPENERLISFKDLSARHLLERYNCSLVQSLLLQAKSITLIIREIKAAKLRKMFKHLKFFRLLCRISSEQVDDETSKGSESPIRVVIDGPLSLFENTQKYGLQLASFFPAVCHLTEWELEATVKYKGKQTLLKLNQNSKLTGHYNHFGSYVPEEIGLFQREFESKTEGWNITDDTSFLPLSNEELVFPDFSFQNQKGVLIHLELFHRWHAAQLLARLQYGNANPDVPLIIGVDRSIYKKPEIRKKLDKSPWFAKCGFLFNDFPGVDRVYKCLEGHHERKA